jgi:hypothetical protein
MDFERLLPNGMATQYCPDNLKTGFLKHEALRANRLTMPWSLNSLAICGTRDS